MGDKMKRTFIFLVGLSIGIYLLVFRKQFARSCIKDQNRLWGFHFGEREVWISEIVAVIVGFGFILFAVLAALGVGRVK